MIAFYRTLTLNVIGISPFLFCVLLMAFELTMAFLILYKDKFVKIGLIGTIIFLAGMAPLSWL